MARTEAQKRYALSVKGKAQQRRDNTSAAGVARRQRYEETEKGREKVRSNQARSKKRNADFITGYKLAKGCTDCGYRAHPEALDFDHIPGRGVKRANVNTTYFSTCSLDNIMAEIAKCEVVCANCHRVRTHARRTTS